MSRLEIDIERKVYPPTENGPGPLVLQSLRMTLEDREFVCLLGPSGCGKTTLLNCVAALDRNFEGSVSLPSVAGRDLAAVGYVFQNPRLLPWRTVRQNIDLVLTEGGLDEATVSALLDAAGLTTFQGAFPERLSLGQERRVALVRAFAIQPDVLLLDEPFVSLDEATAQRLRLLLLQVWRERPTTVLFVTHDLREAIQLADRIVLLSEGPASVIANIPITLSREERSHSQRLEDYRRALIAEYPNLTEKAVAEGQQSQTFSTEMAGDFSPARDR